MSGQQDQNGQLQRRRRANAANIIRDIFNEMVPLREGNKVRLVPSCEGMIRVTVMNARKGDPKALSTIMTLLEMTGRTKDKTEEEREKNILRLPRPAPTTDEYLLLALPEREKDRDRYLAMALEEEGIPNDPSRPSNKNAAMDALTGPRNDPNKHDPAIVFAQADALLARGEFSKAFHEYESHSRRIKSALENGYYVEKNEALLQVVRQRLAETITPLLHIRHFRDALECADTLIKEKSASLSVHAGHVIALIFMDRGEEAQKAFERHRGKVEGGKFWERIVGAEIDLLRQVGIVHPAVDRLQGRLGVRPRVTTSTSPSAEIARVKTKKPAPTIPAGDDLESEDRLIDEGRLCDALELYGRTLRDCNDNLSKQRLVGRWVDERNRTVEKIHRLVLRLIVNGAAQQALPGIEKCLEALPGHPKLQIFRAHVLMFAGMVEEARAVYYRVGTMKLGNGTGHQLVSEDLRIFRQAGVRHPLMDEMMAADALGTLDAET